MPTTMDYLRQLQEDKQNLIDNLIEQGVEVSENSTFTDLTPKVLDVETKPNIFVQTTQPETKNGIWVQTNKTYDKVIIDEEMSSGATWVFEKKMPSIPSDVFPGYSACDDNEVFVVRSSGSGTVYKYNINDEEWTTLGNPNMTNPKIALSDKYFFVDTYSSNAYIYDRINNTSRRMSHTYINFDQSGQCIVGDDLYCFYYADSKNNAIKMSLIDGTITKLSALPKSTKQISYNETCVYTGNNIIYLFLHNSVFTFNIDTQTYTKIKDLDVSVSSQNVAYLNNGYIYFGYVNTKDIYRFNLSNNELEYLNTIDGLQIGDKTLTGANRLNFAFIDNAYVIFNGLYKLSDGTTSQDIKETFTLSLNKSTYPQDTLILQQGNYNLAYPVDLFPSEIEGGIKTPISNVYIYNDDELFTNLPTYIGDGTSWNKIKG